MDVFESKLRSRLGELDARLNEVESALDAPAPADFEERAVEREGDEVLEGLGHAGLAEVRAIEAALARIEAGTYGTCAACGERISTERLEAVPHAARCRDCA